MAREIEFIVSKDAERNNRKVTPTLHVDEDGDLELKFNGTTILYITKAGKLLRAYVSDYNAAALGIQLDDGEIRVGI